MNVFAVRREGLKNAVSLAYSFALAADDDGEWREGGGEIVPEREVQEGV